MWNKFAKNIMQSPGSALILTPRKNLGIMFLMFFKKEIYLVLKCNTLNIFDKVYVLLWENGIRLTPEPVVSEDDK